MASGAVQTEAWRKGSRIQFVIKTNIVITLLTLLIQRKMEFAQNKTKNKNLHKTNTYNTKQIHFKQLIIIQSISL